MFDDNGDITLDLNNLANDLLSSPSVKADDRTETIDDDQSYQNLKQGHVQHNGNDELDDDSVKKENTIGDQQRREDEEHSQGKASNYENDERIGNKDEGDQTNNDNDNSHDDDRFDESTKKNDDAPMNVLILYPDDWRHDSIGSEKPYVLTPFLDSLSREGIRFTHNAVTTSVCWMSRATLWMGQYSSRHQSYKLKCPRFAFPDKWKHSWIPILQKQGYFIGHVGKWQYYTRDQHKFFNWSKMFEGHHWEKIFGGRAVHASDLAAEYATAFFDERPKDKPFVLSVAFYPPKPVGDGRAPGHQFSPTNETKKLYENMTIPEPKSMSKQAFKKLPDFLNRGPAVCRFGQRYSTPEHFQASMRNYYALVTGVDKACKVIVDKLKEEGLYNNTMIIFTTDNGMFHGAHGLAGKWYPYQESIRVPLIVYDPRMPANKAGTLNDAFTLNVDLAQTIMGAANVKPDELMQGRDISDLYLSSNKKNEYHDSAYVETEPWRDEFFYEFPSPEEQFIPSSTALVRKEWKYIYWPAHQREQLFNLKDDPLELDDLYDSLEVRPALKDMRQRHNELKSELHSEAYINDTIPCTKVQSDMWAKKTN